MSDILPTAQFASLVFGADAVPLGDPAEDLHEASRLYPNVAPAQLDLMLELDTSPGLQQTVARASKGQRHRPGVDLPRATTLRARFGAVTRRRVSSKAATARPLRIADLAALLDTSYSATIRPGVGWRRPVPSAGALYPLELYVIPLAVQELDRRAYHYHPFDRRLEALGRVDASRIRSALVDPSPIETASAIIVITAMFWRSRCKYGARGYRFALLEAGHVAQNLTLAAAAVGLSVLPVGGFYDRTIDALVGADSLDEASVYVLVVGEAA